MQIEKIILWILSRSPVFSITADKNFHEIKCNEAKYIIEKNLERFSLFSFGFVGKKIYFISITSSNEIDLFKIIKLKDIILMNKFLPTEQEELIENIDKKITVYKNHLICLSEEDIGIEIEFLKYKIESELKREDTTRSKMSHYLNIALAMIPLLAYYINLIININSGISKNILIFLLISFIYLLLNFLMYIYDFNTVKHIYQSMFSDLKNSYNKHNELASLYYLDFYYKRNIENEINVSYVKLCERYLKYSILVGSVFFIFYNFIKSNDLERRQMKKTYISNYENKINIQSSEDCIITKVVKNSDIDEVNIIGSSGTWITETIKNSDTDE